MLPSALAVLWLVAAAQAQPNMTEDNGPVSAAPRNGMCGLTGPGWTEAKIQDHIRDVFTEVWNAAGVKGVKPPLVFKAHDPNKIAFTSHVNQDITIPELQIVVFMTLCDIAHNDDEIAAVLGHELGHVELRHGPKLEELRDKVIEPKCGGTCDEVCCEPKIHEAAMPYESEADKKSVDYLSKPGSRFKPEGAISALKHAKDLKWARYDDKPNPNHPPLTQRVYELTEWAEKAKASK